MKRLISFTLAIIIVIGMAGCSNNAEVERLRRENEKLKEQIEQLNTAPSASENKTKNAEVPIEIISQEAAGTEYGYSHARFTVKNNSGYEINTLTLDIKILDESKTVIETTHPQEGVVISNGESITFDALAEAGAYSMKLDGYSYYSGNDLDSDYITGHFSDVEEVILK